MASPSASLRRSRTYARCVLYGSVRGGSGGLSRSCPAGKPQRGQSQVSGTCALLAKLGCVSCPLEHQKEMRRRGADSPRSASPIGPAPTRLPRIALPLATVVTPCVMVPRSESAFRFVASASVYVRPNARPVIGVTTSIPRRKPHDRPRSAARTEHGALRAECRCCVCIAAQLFVFMMMPSTTMHTNHSRPITTVMRSRFRSATEEPPTDDCMPPPNMSERPPPFPLCISTSSISSRLKTIRAIENPKTTAGPTLSDSDERRGHSHRAVPPQGYDVSPLPHTPSSCHWSRKRTILTNSSESSEAPP